ncbi:hypothetical protein [Fluoribacter gormanii]|uniref:Uncharacterized protein n=1 Tax=Fluoribacter gormanii TaxID=464 RepID=A0A377GKP3_9GAMM|nr:hypothetical protein [Fluoribacter gormanii]KTD01842.1 hypothetical protein Lgor_2219 [Fluoribacter gormanii]SIR22740.1 hypothetical protein SAMN05421777_10888 [Fluoribacter gormanii]STO25387.1 Uncharacterised protein [Fluoribacter gormanii]
MGFYFNTYRQEEGDKAYNEQRYEDALTHYSEALKTLHMHAAAQKARHTDFYDALVYVLSEILTTKLFIIQREAQDSNFAVVANHWQDIPGLLHEMELTHKEHLKKSKHAFSNKEKVISKVRLLLAKICEEVSDALADQLEEDDAEVYLELLKQAIEWMKRGIHFQVKTEGTTKLSSSLGYLNLLERLYKKTQDEAHIRVMSEYINEHNLLERTIKSPLRKLELLSYVARVALFNHQDIHELTLECKALYDLVPEDERDNPILDDLQSLLDLAPQKEREEDEYEVENDEPDVMDDTHSTSGFLEELSDYPITLDKLDEDVYPVDMLMDFQSLSSETTEMSTFSSSSMDTMPADQVMTHSPSFSLPFSVQGFGPAPQPTFFSSPSRAQSLEDELPHSRALQLGLEKITAHSENPRFLANLLSLVADFFHKYKAHYVQKQNAIVLAHDLYQKVFKIDPQHHRAREKLKDIRTQHPRLIGSYQFFSNRPQSPIPTVTARISEAKHYFNQALEELTIELESLLMNQPAKIRITIDELACFICEQLSKGAITSTPCPEIGQMLKNAFEEELKNSMHSASGPESY